MVVIICLFSIMEKTGISAICFFAKIHVMITNNQAAKQSNDTSESSETKQAELKEYWVIFNDHKITHAAVNTQQTKYYSKNADLHLSWYPPVATPPPNFLV
jgi:hypothetical protein